MDENLLSMRKAAESSLEHWREKEKKALKLLKLAGDLRFDRSVELVLFRQDIYDQRPSEVIHLHQQARTYLDQPLPLELSLAFTKALDQRRDLPAAKIDLGKLAAEWFKREESAEWTEASVRGFLEKQLSHIFGQEPVNDDPKDVILYGFGRIGRLVARRIIATTGRGEQLRLKAIVVRAKLKDRLQEAQKRAALLRDDSIHGAFPGTVEVVGDGHQLLINGNTVQLIFANHPTDLDYTQYGIREALVIDNTGVWRDHESLSQHLRPGVAQVMLTAPGKDMPNIVYGVNQTRLEDPAHRQVFCAASCTTNAIVPILKVIDDQLGIEKGHIETIHAYTSDQNLLDNFHKKPRRGRGAAINMVLTSTGAAKAVAKVLPHLSGVLTGNAVRVPTPDVSLAIINLTVKSTTNVEALNGILKQASMHGELVEQIYFSDNDEYVSSNAIGMTTTSVLDAPSTIVSRDGKNITLYAWYDNEFGYTCQVVRLAKFAARVRRYVFY